MCYVTSATNLMKENDDTAFALIIVFLIQFILNVGMMTAHVQKYYERGEISTNAFNYIYCTSCALVSLPVIGSPMVLMTHTDFSNKMSR